MNAADWMGILGMRPHPEGGHYVETWRGPPGTDGRPVGTAILFLLRNGECSHWHRVDADELWHFHDGDPLRLSISEHGDDVDERLLGLQPALGQRPQIHVPANAWQAAVTTGSWTLVSCTVAPGFEFAGWELAPPGWVPKRSGPASADEDDWAAD